MFDIPLRRLKDALADPCARHVPVWITPGHITFAAFVCGIASCISATFPSRNGLSLSFWLANRALDCLDGSVARHRNVASALGGFLDLLSDFIIYSLLPIAIAHGQDINGSPQDVSWLSIALLEASFHVNNFILFYGAAVAAQRDDRELTSVTMRPALIEGFESGLLFTVMLIWPAHITTLSWLMSAGVAVGILQRSWAISSVLKQETTNKNKN